jgi:hypothetical protein
MAHRFASFLWLFIAVNALLLVSCSKMDPNPELKDPIYRDIETELKNSAKLLTDTEKKLEGLKLEEAKLAPRTKERMVNGRAIQNQKNIIEKLTQRIAYLEIRLERRKIQTKNEYSAAYSAKKPWPDPAEYENYKMMQKLQSAPRNWDHRVPKFKTDKSE